MTARTIPTERGPVSVASVDLAAKPILVLALERMPDAHTILTVEQGRELARALREVCDILDPPALLPPVVPPVDRRTEPRALPHADTIVLDPANRDGARMRVLDLSPRAEIGIFDAPPANPSAPLLVGMGDDVLDPGAAEFIREWEQDLRAREGS